MANEGLDLFADAFSFLEICTAPGLVETRFPLLADLVVL
jgi:hypothetical protein